MIYWILLFLSTGLACIFDKNIENIFIIIATVTCYKIIINNEINIKEFFTALILSIMAINLMILFGFRDYTYRQTSEQIVEKEETLVLLVYEGESKTYNIREKSTQIYFEEKYKSLYSGILKLHTYKHYYEDLGYSDFDKDVFEISEYLKKQLDSQYIVMNTNLYSQPYFENTVEVAIQQGYKKILICPVFMTEGIEYQVLQDRYEKIDLLSRKITEVEILSPLYNSRELVESYSKGLIDEIKKYDNDAGILLVGLEDRNNSKQDVEIRNSIKQDIESKNSLDELDIKIKVPYSKSNHFDIIKCADELLEYGIDTLYVVCPTISVDTMHSNNIVEKLNEKINIGYTKYYYFTPDNKNQAIAEAIYNMIQSNKNI